MTELLGTLNLATRNHCQRNGLQDMYLGLADGNVSFVQSISRVSRAVAHLEVFGIRELIRIPGCSW